jgi:two-component system cell cycle sensor histidine kinase/response regulator CckA
MSPALNGKADHGWYRVSVKPMRNNAESYVRWKVSEVTEDRVEQEHIFQELQVAIHYLDNAPAGFFSLLRNGSIAYMNATLARWLDYDLASAGSASLMLSDIASQDVAALLTNLPGKPGEETVETLDVDLRQRNGRPLPVRLLHRVSFGAGGEAKSSSTLVLNRLSGATAADTGDAYELRYVRLFNNSPMAIASLDGEGKIVNANTSFIRLFGALSPIAGKMEGLPVSVIISDAQRQDFTKSILSAVTDGCVDPAPLELLSAEESPRALRVWTQPVTDAGDPKERAVVFALDRTELRQVEEQLVQAQKMNAIGQLAGGIAHDFNNVLQAILGNCELLLLTMRPTDSSYQGILQIKENSKRAARLVRQLLAFSRRQTLMPTVLNLNDILSDLATDVLRRVMGGKVRLELFHGRSLWPVQADVNQLENVIINLSVNARDAMPEGGLLTIRTSNVTKESTVLSGGNGILEGDYVLIEVEDTGHGMTPEIKAKIFEPFFTTKGIGKGTGLGLATVFGIIQQSGGFIDVESEVGKGTVFRIYLPRYVEEPKAQVEDEPAAGDGSGSVAPVADLTGQGVILLVDDDDPVRMVNKRALEMRGYSVLEAVSGVEALKVVDTLDKPLDLVISDVMMPEMDGLTLLGELRNRDPSIKVMLVSGDIRDDLMDKMPEDGSLKFLPKPFSIKQLIETVKSIIGH